MTQAYEIEDGEYGDQKGALLVGPEGFECFLGESEDCNWDRDGHEAVTCLNEQHAEIEAMKSIIVGLRREVEEVAAQQAMEDNSWQSCPSYIASAKYANPEDGGRE